MRIKIVHFFTAKSYTSGIFISHKFSNFLNGYLVNDFFNILENVYIII
jgi:hypothetical protein